MVGFVWNLVGVSVCCDCMVDFALVLLTGWFCCLVLRFYLTVWIDCLDLVVVCLFSWGGVCLLACVRRLWLPCFAGCLVLACALRLWFGLDLRVVCVLVDYLSFVWVLVVCSCFVCCCLFVYDVCLGWLVVLLRFVLLAWFCWVVVCLLSWCEFIV